MNTEETALAVRMISSPISKAVDVSMCDECGCIIILNDGDLPEWLWVDRYVYHGETGMDDHNCLSCHHIRSAHEKQKEQS
jgi:hypothetical protein